jgi:CarboxypepD_reg-like domain/TonB-dependent Receptor Plug Domain
MTNKLSRILVIITATYFLSIQVKAQLVQNIRGTVLDNILQTPIPSATITLTNSNQTTTTDSLGNFKFKNIAVGFQNIKITHFSFKEINLYNQIVNAGKELVLTIPMEAKPQIQKEVIVKGERRKNKPTNEMSIVSARAFTVEETQKYAAALNDPLRMATNFAGVISANDGNNSIVIRGNSPAGLLWRMEGVDIPNPNHFSNAGSSGGGISILSAQLLANSDFVTGAFAAEYGNAVGGVFDLKLRKGNNEHKEFSLQAGVLGINLSAEGPFKKGYSGSYLINYRYSTLSLLTKVGVLPNQNPTNFQDLSYNINLPTKKAGTFTLFGFSGFSDQSAKYLNDSTKWKSDEDRYGANFTSNTGVNAATHFIKLHAKSTLKSAVSYAKTSTASDVLYARKINTIEDFYKEKYTTTKLNFTTTLNYKIQNNSTLRSGIIINKIGYNYFQKAKDNINDPLREVLNVKGTTTTLQAYTQWQFKPIAKINLNVGIHYVHLLLNNTKAIEPRASIKWDITNKQSLSFGYGLHSQIQALGVYFAQSKDALGATTTPNKNIGFTQSQHFVLSHNFLLDRNLRLRTELYYQKLNKVPVSTSDTNTFSALNIIDDFITEPLINKGKGTNYGIEISLEKYLSNNFYYMLSNSFYQSKYVAKDGIERNTRFNGGYASNFIAGKDFVSKNQRRTFGLNLKVVVSGGFRTTPIDVEKSKNQGYAYYIQNKAFDNQNAAYQRTDLRLSMKWNRKKVTSTLSLDIQNVTNRLNVGGTYYDNFKQLGILPILNYKIEF